MANYFKNTELAARYNISESTVRNWVKAVKAGKLQLDLAEDGKRSYVAKSISNMPIIEELVGKNRKYRNSLAAKTVTASPELFKVYNEIQVYDIVRNLELHHEIPLQYGYFNKGAKYWDEYIKGQMQIDAPSILRETINLLADNLGYIDQRLMSYRKVNVIDIGTGNAFPVKQLLAHLLAKDKLRRYIALDFSKEILEISKKHLVEWFGGTFPFEGYQLDITHERFSTLLAEDYLRHADDTVNLILFLGATPINFRNIHDAFRTVCESMNIRDTLIYTDRLELTDKPPEWIEFGIKQSKIWVTKLLRLVFDLLNVEESFYEIEVGFDTLNRQRYARTRFKIAVKVTFNFSSGPHTIAFEKGDTITLWRAWQYTPQRLHELLQDSGFYLLHSSQTADRGYILTIAEVQRD